MARAWRGAVGGDGRKHTSSAVRIEGLAELQRAFKRIDGNLGKDTRKVLREIAVPVQQRAKALAPVLTGALRSSIKIGATTRALSVYSNAPHALVQDRGGRVGKGAVIQRARASAYMTRAVQEGRANVEHQLGELGDRIADRFEGRT